MKTYLKCSNCFKIKPTEQFYRKLGGRQSRCKLCNREICVNYQREKRRQESRNHLEPLVVQ